MHECALHKQAKVLTTVEREGSTIKHKNKNSRGDLKVDTPTSVTKLSVNNDCVLVSFACVNRIPGIFGCVIIYFITHICLERYTNSIDYCVLTLLRVDAR